MPKRLIEQPPVVQEPKRPCIVSDINDINKPFTDWSQYYIG